MSDLSLVFQGRQLEDVYELDRIVSWIRDSNINNVALQFPNELLPDACEVSKKIEALSNAHSLIMGENNFGSTCCVDEHTASTLSVDGIVHFGHACLSPHSILPVLYVLGNQQLAEDKLLHVIDELLVEAKSVIVSCDVMYYQSLELWCLNKLDCRNVFLIKLTNQVGSCIERHPGSKLVSWEECKTILPCQEETVILHVGTDMQHATNIMLKHPSSRYYVFNPLDSELKEISSVKHSLARKRYYLVEKIKNSSLIGILVGTLEVGNSVQMITKLKEMISAAGKRSCLIVIGKVSPAKLANFPEVDCFVIVACPANTLHDSKEYFCPIVTPYELAVALNYAQWTESYETDFHNVLKDLEDVTVSSRTADHDQERDEDECADDKLGALSIPNPLTIGTNNFIAAGGTRVWRGLEPGVHETAVKKAEPGRSGLAMSYNTAGDEAM